MTTITINVPDDYTSYLKDSNEYQSVITELTEDYIEKKQDNNLKIELSNNSYFQSLNNSLETEL